MGFFGEIDEEEGADDGDKAGELKDQIHQYYAAFVGTAGGLGRTIPSMMKIHRHPLLPAKPAICMKPKARMPERAEARLPMR